MDRNLCCKASVVSLASLMLLLWVGAAMAQRPATVRVGTIPIIDTLPFFVARDKGYFEAEGIKVEPVPMAAGAVIIPALVGGSLEVGFGSTVSTILAVEQGFDFLITADDVYNSRTSSIGVRKDSGINTVRDLQGKNVAANVIKGPGWLYLREVVAKHGGDPETLKWLEIPFPQMVPALLGKKIDAGEMVEPFETLAKETPELKILVYHYAEVDLTIPLANYFASKKWIEAHSDVVERFARAHKKGVDFFNNNFAEARALLPKYTGIKPELAAKVSFKTFKNKLEPVTLQRQIELMLKHGLIKKRLKAEDMIYKTAM